jgi:L-fuculose-phosphate aldolase
VHTHAPALIAAGIRGFDIAGLLPELRLATSEVVLLPLLTSGSDELGRAVGEAVAGGAGVVLLRQHGAVSVGADVETAANRMELAELAAYAALLSEVGGGAAEMERVRVLARALE